MATLSLDSLSQSRPGPAAEQQAIQSNNLGVAYMNQQRMEKAAQLFAAAHQQDPQLVTARLNQGIALLNAQKLAEAKLAFEDVIKQDPANVAAWYNLGLVSRSSNDMKQTIQAFQQVVKLDPRDANAHYFLGSSYLQQSEYANAVAEFEQALRLNPLHASAEFGLGRAEQHLGDTGAARHDLLRFQRITEEKLGSPLTPSYGEMGRYSLAQSVHSAEPEVGPMIPVKFVPVTIGAPVASVTNDSAGGACLIDAEGNGRDDLITLGRGEHALHVYRNTGGLGFKEIAGGTTGLDLAGAAIGCTVGDFDNDGLPDIAVSMSDRVVLFKNLGHGRFSDVTKAAGITATNRPAGLTFVDYDHDGDLDLFVTGRASGGVGPNALWRNNGNGTFTNWTEQAGLAGEGVTRNATLSDLNNDRAVDLVVTGNGAAPTFFANPREGPFHASRLYSGNDLPPTNGVYVFDFNKDGWMDVAVTHEGAPGATLWRNVEGKRFERVPLPLTDATRGWGLTAIDFDNDGWIDLAVLVDTAHGPEVRILRNRGARGFEDVTAAVGLAHVKLRDPRGLLATDVDGDGDTDLIVTQADGSAVLLRNDGGNKNHWLRLSLQGLADNKSAIGAKVEIFAGTLWQKWEIAGASGYMGQSSPEILAGLGGEPKADIVRMVWPTGVLQDEINIAGDKRTALEEIDRRGSSCPVLFAWDGRQYRFVSDVIGAAVVGHWVSPTSKNIPDADEWIKVSGDELRPQNGYLSVRFGEPMEEVNFVDQLRLVAIDHPAGTEVYPNERFLSQPPFPREKVVVSSAAHPVVRAWDDHGNDVTALLLHRDHQYVRGFTNLSFAGFTNPHKLTFDIGPWNAGHPLQLLLHGYIEYFSASSMYAAWQAGLQPEPPRLEAQMPDGSWKVILRDMGFPAGLPRTITVDLTGKLPPGVHRLRIVTNLQIYWDQILVDNGPDRASEVRQTELPLAISTLAFRGYPQQIEGKTPGDLTYRYDRISRTGPFARQRGAYTRYGDVTPLLRKIDNQFVIFGSGEDIDAEFRADALPPLPPHWQRDYFFYANGFVKDMDFYEAAPFTVAKLPFHGMKTYPYSKTQHYPMTSSAVQYRLKWNTRFDSGESTQRYQFHYVPTASAPILPGQPQNAGTN
jgi:Tfp pilus assembly protein PilF